MSDLHTVDRLEALPTPVPDGTFVVVDVIICSTAIIRLLEAGAEYVRPFAETSAALAFRRNTDGAVLVGEENGGETSEQFDHPPAPQAIRQAAIAGRPVGIRTSNGTRAIDRIGTDDGLLVGSTINAAAVGELLRDRDGESWIVAAGRDGSPVPEDLAAVELIRQQYDGDRDEWDQQRLFDRIDPSPSAAWLRAHSNSGIETVLDFDSSETVPFLRDGVFVPYDR